MENRKLIDLSHTVEDGMITYKGLPPPVISEYLSREESRARYAEGTAFQIGKIEMVANTGTYLDSPFHRYSEGQDLSQLGLPSMANLEGLVVRAEGERKIGIELLENRDLQGKAILINTGWDRYWGSDRYFDGYPFLSMEAAQLLEDAGAVLVGIDSLNIDDTTDGTRPAHSVLLGSDIPIVEHLCNLDRLPDEGFHFFAVPVKIKGFGTFPVRAFAIID
ncbi:MAG: cyclase [Candidatus Solincola sediminis]|uniref:Cyclase n=1 Tax=Candidatus Solincola sediminis TaxID=1797199 RepID=A0A1F2WMZ0_9ACTN|nr:MAG: cyclase [Candidatus Solincola sediminis]OFW58225.1 MAG: cyclase [Candidatus Solincola sediminis]